MGRLRKVSLHDGQVQIGDDSRPLPRRTCRVADVLIRVNTNGAWQTPEEALANLRALAPDRAPSLARSRFHGIDHLRIVAAESQ